MSFKERITQPTHSKTKDGIKGDIFFVGYLQFLEKVGDEEDEGEAKMSVDSFPLSETEKKKVYVSYPDKFPEKNVKTQSSVCASGHLSSNISITIPTDDPTKDICWWEDSWNVINRIIPKTWTCVGYLPSSCFEEEKQSLLPIVRKEKDSRLAYAENHRLFDLEKYKSKDKGVKENGEGVVYIHEGKRNGAMWEVTSVLPSLSQGVTCLGDLEELQAHLGWCLFLLRREQTEGLRKVTKWLDATYKSELVKDIERGSEHLYSEDVSNMDSIQLVLEFLYCVFHRQFLSERSRTMSGDRGLWERLTDLKFERPDLRMFHIALKCPESENPRYFWFANEFFSEKKPRTRWLTLLRKAVDDKEEDNSLSLLGKFSSLEFVGNVVISPNMQQNPMGAKLWNADPSKKALEAYGIIFRQVIHPVNNCQISWKSKSPSVTESHRISLLSNISPIVSLENSTEDVEMKEVKEKDEEDVEMTEKDKEQKESKDSSSGESPIENSSIEQLSGKKRSADEAAIGSAAPPAKTLKTNAGVGVKVGGGLEESKDEMEPSSTSDKPKAVIEKTSS